MSRQRVLFLCTGNSACSQMAEAFLRKYGNEQFEVHSAGLEPKGVNPLTIQVMKEAGIDISRHTSKGIEAYLGKTLFQTLITFVIMPKKTAQLFGRESIPACIGHLKTLPGLKARKNRS